MGETSHTVLQTSIRFGAILSWEWGQNVTGV
jgi:hypothetical protein